MIAKYDIFSVYRDSFMIFFRARFGNKKNPALLSAVESSGHRNTTISKVF